MRDIQTGLRQFLIAAFEPSLFQHGMSLNEGVYFHGGMSLRRCDWVDHPEHGDRDERTKADDELVLEEVFMSCSICSQM